MSKCGWRCYLRLAAAIAVFATLPACSSSVQRPEFDLSQRLRDTANLVQEVKAFGKTIGIEPTEALSRTSQEAPALSMIWLWLQRVGSLAVRTPIDIRMGIGFSTIKEQLKLEQVYRVDGYSVYYRQGNEFADPRSVATFSFADSGTVRRVKVVLHEDLHGAKNFDLPWEIEESIVTPLASLAAVEFFRHKGDAEHLEQALRSLEEEGKFSRELNALVKEAEIIFRNEPADEAKKIVIELIAAFPTYHRQFQRQLAGQHPPTSLEAKLSHDLAYYRLHERLVSLEQQAGGLRRLIEDLKRLPRHSTHEGVEQYLRDLDLQYDTNIHSH
jgi:hypothetical protein